MSGNSGVDDQRFKLGSESELTYKLKWEAWEWLYCVARCRCIGLEVRLQGPWGSIVDVVGIGPGNAIYAVEVKVSRSDFARDNHTEADIARLRKRAGSWHVGSSWLTRQATGHRPATSKDCCKSRNDYAKGWRRYPPSSTTRAF